MKSHDIIDNIGKVVIWKNKNHFSPSKDQNVMAVLVDRSLHSPSRVQIDVLVRGDGVLERKHMANVKVENVTPLNEYLNAAV